MAQAVALAPSKSTNVRSLELTLTLVRLGLRSLGVMAPHMADRIAADRFFTPRRPAEPRAPEVPGLKGRAFRVDSSFGRLAAWSWGEGPTVLLAHGWEGAAAQFVPFIQPLVSAGYRAVAFDMPAHGFSEGRQVSVVKMAKAIQEVAEDTLPFRGFHRESPFALIGHSLGGAATALALREGLTAERVVLLAPVAEPSPFARRAAELLQLSPERTAGLFESIRTAVGRDFSELDVRNFASSLPLPALVFHDPADREVPYEHGRGIAQAWPGARLIPVEGAGHRRILRDAGVVGTAVRFLTETPTPLLHAV